MAPHRPAPDGWPARRLLGGSGVLGAHKSIQRVATVGGVMPTAPCTQADTGKVARVPYKADYDFYQ